MYIILMLLLTIILIFLGYKTTWKNMETTEKKAFALIMVSSTVYFIVLIMVGIIIVKLPINSVWANFICAVVISFITIMISQKTEFFVKKGKLEEASIKLASKIVKFLTLTMGILSLLNSADDSICTFEKIPTIIATAILLSVTYFLSSMKEDLDEKNN